MIEGLDVSDNKGQKSGQLQWRRVDLHIHTPASSDYEQPNVSYLDILRRARERGLDIIAFTDHNTVAGYAAMLAEIEELELLERLGRLRPEERRRLDEYRRLRREVLVLPGFEFTATFGFHILGIFSDKCSVRELEHILLDLNIPADKLDEGSTEVGATADVLTAYRLIDEAGGIVIAAHANSAHGVAMRGFGFGGQTKIAYTQDPHLHALEVTDLESKGRHTTAAFYSGSKPEYPRPMRCIQGSDAHRLTKSGNSLGVGDRVLITRRGSMLGRLTERDIIETSLEHDDSEIALASTEIVVHRAIYAKTNALAIVHGHPVHTIMRSLLEDEIVPIDSEASYLLQGPPDQGAPGSNVFLEEGFAVSEDVIYEFRGSVV